MRSCLGRLLGSVLLAAVACGPAPAQELGRPVALPPPLLQGAMPVEQALLQRRSKREFAAEPLALQDVAQVLWAAQGVTDPRGWRTAPSAGALAPLEVYLVAGSVSGLPPGAYRYRPQAHTLLPVRAGELRPELAAAALGQGAIRDAPAVLAIAAAVQRTQARYGGRAERFVHLEAGHAAQNVYLQCTARGLATVFIGSFDDARLRAALGLPAEQAPLGLMPFGRAK